MTTLLDDLQALLVLMYEKTLAVPDKIVLPPRAFDPLMTELTDRGLVPAARPGLFGFYNVGQSPVVDIVTYGGVVRIERSPT